MVEKERFVVEQQRLQLENAKTQVHLAQLGLTLNTHSEDVQQ